MLKQVIEGSMRLWLLQCFQDEHDQEMIKELSFEYLKIAVDRHYHGGYTEFIKSIYEEVKI